MSVGSWLGTTLLVALHAAWRSLWPIAVVVRHPLESARLLVTLPWLLFRVRALWRELHDTGVVIVHPPEAPLLRTVLTGLRDSTTSVVRADAVTPALAAAHLASVRARLDPLEQVFRALLRTQAVAFAAAACASFDATREGYTTLASLLLSGASAFAVSLAWSLLVRLFAELLVRYAASRLRVS